MVQRILTTHVRDDSSRIALLKSVAVHLSILLMVFLGGWLFPPLIIPLGGGGSGDGEFIRVGLSDELSGGAGMYKPSIVAQPAAAPPQARKTVEEPVAEKPETVFEESSKTPERKPKPAEQTRSSPPVPNREQPSEPAAAGVIPDTPMPGSGGMPGSSAGSGGGEGAGLGISLGPGVGPGIDSWYIRQVEQRVGQNWLQTALGRIDQPVRTVIQFDVARNGVIEAVTILESSGNASVDLAAQRAVRASNPLPPLPPELRRRNVRFVAHFQYPPR